MKTMKSFLLVTLLAAGTTLMAQTTVRSSNETPAFKQTNHLVNTLQLTEVQIVEVLAINQKYADLAAYNTSNQGEKPQHRAISRNNNTMAQAKAIKSVLKGYQKEKFEYMVANHEAFADQSAPRFALNNPQVRNRVSATIDNAPRSRMQAAIDTQSRLPIQFMRAADNRFMR
jgi:hypothetical protein